MRPEISRLKNWGGTYRKTWYAVFLLLRTSSFVTGRRISERLWLSVMRFCWRPDRDAGSSSGTSSNCTLIAPAFTMLNHSEAGPIAVDLSFCCGDKSFASDRSCCCRHTLPTEPLVPTDSTMLWRDICWLDDAILKELNWEGKQTIRR